MVVLHQHILLVSRLRFFQNDIGNHAFLCQLLRRRKGELRAHIEAVVHPALIGSQLHLAIVCVLWAILIPTYKPFMQYILGYSAVEKLFGLVMILFAFNILYAFQNVFDCTFYGRGKTKYMLFESVVTNSIYYGIFFVLYLTGVWTPTLVGIALMFGFGNAFDSIVSGIAYAYFLKKNHYNILDI